MPSQNVQAAFKKVSITRNAKVTVGKTVKIKLKNNRKKVTWKVTKGKKLIKITKKSKSYAKIRGIKTGTAKIQAVTGRKKYTCTVTVSAAKNKPIATSRPKATKRPMPIKPTEPKADLTISSERELNEFAQKVNSGNNYSGKLIQLTADIQYDGVTANNFTPIAIAAHREFQGIFDGCGHMISGIDVTDTKGEYAAALFGYIGSGGTVKNLYVSNSSFIYGGKSKGDCIACKNYGAINNCHTYQINADEGIVYYNYGTIMNCSSASDIMSGSARVGGIVSYNEGKILNCCNLGDIHSTNTEDYISIGGICGKNEGTVQNCYNIGVINSQGTGSIGGITGYNGETAVVANSYCAEESATSNFGNMLGVEKDCKAFPRSEMQTETFVDLLNANRGNNVAWLEWNIEMEGYTYPMPTGEQELPAVSATEAPNPTEIPEQNG